MADQEKKTVNHAPLFESQSGWSAGYTLAKGEGPGVVVGPGVDNPNVFAQPFTTQPGQQFRITARAASVDKAEAQAAVQINWHAADGKFLAVTQEYFRVGQGETRFERTISAPDGAAGGTLYVVPGGQRDTIRYTEMRLTRLDPLEDFASYEFFGVTGQTLVLGALAIVALILLLRNFTRAVQTAVARKATWLGWAFPSLAVSALVAMLFLMQGNYEQHYDSQYHEGMAEIVLKWNEPSLSLGGNPTYAFGIQHLVKPYLSATFLLGRLMPADIRIPAQAAFQAVLMLLIGVAICWRCGATVHQAFAICLVAMMYCWVPMLSREAITLNATLGLYWQEAALATFLAFLLFSLVGVGSVQASVSSAAALGMLVLWYLIAFTYNVPYFVLALTFLCAGVALSIQSRREFIHKSVAAVVIAVMLLSLGTVDYVQNIFSYTPQNFYRIPFRFDYTSLLFSAHLVGGGTVYLFFALAAIGVVAVLYRGNDFARKVVFAGLTLEVGVLIATVLNVAFEIIPLHFTYVEQTGIAVVALLAGAGVWTIFGLIGHAIDWGLETLQRREGVPATGIAATMSRVTVPVRRLSVGPNLPVLGIAVFAALVVRELSRPAQYYPGWPPRLDSLPAQIQTRELGLQPGDTFKGRSLTLLEMATPRPIQWGPDYFPILYFKYRRALGNDLMNDARAVGVPVSNEYGHFASPPMLALFAAAFYNPADPINRAAQNPRIYRANLARLLGIGLVVSDAPLSGETRLYEGQAGGHPLFIHKVSGTNVGQFSPTRVVVARTAAEALDQLQKPDFDGQHMAVTERPIRSPLVNAGNVTVRLKKGPSIEVAATSGGTSLLVLPFEWSNCLDARGQGLVDMVPVDLALIGLVIQGDAQIEINYRYGLFADTSCRKKDLQRAIALDLANAAPGRLFLDHRGQR